MSGELLPKFPINISLMCIHASVSKITVNVLNVAIFYLPFFCGMWLPPNQFHHQICKIYANKFLNVLNQIHARNPIAKSISDI